MTVRTVVPNLPESWTCPHCNRPTTITGSRCDAGESNLAIGSGRDGSKLSLRWLARRCPNPNCCEPTVTVELGTVKLHDDVEILGSAACISRKRLIPDSDSKRQPDYIPRALCDDYYEACNIRDLSPKAAAALARRCLQGIIRDFWAIKGKGTLSDEIAALKGSVDTALWDAIDALRGVGNIGAHMERDVNVIIDVEPEEAQKLIGLIEILFEETYVARHDRDRRVAEMKALGAEKRAEQKSKRTAAKASTTSP